MCYTSRMTPRQKRIISILLIANVAFFAALLTFMVLFSGSMPAALVAPSPVPTYQVETHFRPVCQRRAAELLSEAGLGGTATLTDQTLRLDLVYHVPDDGQTAYVSQQVWTAFDVVLALTDSPCDIFSQIEVLIVSQGVPRSIQVYAGADLADLRAFRAGELSEHLFIDRVQYRVEPVHDS